jgi:hypothetical protein
MIWAGMSASGKTELVFLQGKQDSIAYCYTIETYLLPYAYLHYGDYYVFQQDNASIHTAFITRQMFQEHRINLRI